MRKIRQLHFVRVCGWALGFCLTAVEIASGQYSSNFQTNNYNAVTNNWPGNYLVGSNTFADVLRIINAGVLSNGTGFVGYETSSSNNVAYVTGGGSIWTNKSNVYVGYTGAGNGLAIVSNGAVYSASGVIGNNTQSSNSVATVDGTNSIWNIVNGLDVGLSGSGNRLTITNGGVVTSDSGRIGFSGSSHDNKVLAIGGGSVWSIRVGLFLGYSGAANQLVVSNGALLAVGFDALIGYDVNSSNNLVTVAGSGSVWTNARNLYVGEQGSANRLSIIDGGAVYSADGTVGDLSVIGSNVVIVSGGNSRWDCLADLRVGNSGAGNQMIISNGGAVANNTGSIGGFGSGEIVSVIGTASVWSNRQDLYVGGNSSRNSLMITGGGRVFNVNGFIGYANSSISNTVLVSGSGSIWYNRGNLFVGYSGSTNRLDIGVGSSTIASNTYVGYNVSSTANQINITGGSLFVTNAAHNAVLDMRCGTLTFSSGLLQADILTVTNPCGRFIQTGGTLSITTTNLDPNLSAVGDGIPNGWKQQYGLDPFDPNLSGKDNDGDGMNNLQEYQAVTDPTNSVSYFHVTSVNWEGDDVRVTWMTGPSRTNALYRGDSVTNITTEIFAVTNTTGTVTNYLDVGAATNVPALFYHVGLVP
jgi:T5SS/PEP-CTERM-associated repeat protein